MPTSPNTTPLDEIVRQALTVLEAMGYTCPWNRKTTTLPAYLATALTGIGGTPVSHLRRGFPELLAGLANALGAGPVSHLTTGITALFSLIANAQAAVIASTGKVTVNASTGVSTFSSGASPNLHRQISLANDPSQMALVSGAIVTSLELTS